MMRLLAIDPGPQLSALLVYDTVATRPVWWEKLRNEEALRLLGSDHGATVAAIEMVASYGMSVGADVFETVWWTGRFAEAWRRRFDQLPRRVYRRHVKTHLCGSQQAKDGNIRQALIDRYGPGKDAAVGRKDAPGPLYGLHHDGWQALGVAITAVECFEVLAAA